MKFVTFASAPAPQSVDSFARWVAQEYAPTILRGAPSCCGFVMRRRHDGGLPGWPEVPADPKDQLAPCDVALEYWFPSIEDFRREILGSELRLRETGARHMSFASVPRLQKDPRFCEAGPEGKRPGITLIAPIRWRLEVPPVHASVKWDLHAPVALRTQPAMTKYEQNVVAEMISWTPGLPAINAYADFSFRSLEDMAKRFVFTQEEEQEISSYVGAFQAILFDDAFSVNVP